MDREWRRADVRLGLRDRWPEDQLWWLAAWDSDERRLAGTVLLGSRTWGHVSVDGVHGRCIPSMARFGG